MKTTLISNAPRTCCALMSAEGQPHDHRHSITEKQIVSASPAGATCMEVTDGGIKLPLLVCSFQLATLIPHKRQTRGVKKNNNKKKQQPTHSHETRSGKNAIRRNHRQENLSSCLPSWGNRTRCNMVQVSLLHDGVTVPDFPPQTLFIELIFFFFSFADMTSVAQ